MILLPLEPERRKGERRSVDDRGAYTVEVDGKVVIRPRSDLTPAKVIEAAPADVSAFIFDDTFRGTSQ